MSRKSTAGGLVPAPDDPDNPEWTATDFARAVPPEALDAEAKGALFAALPLTAEAARKRGGRPSKPPGVRREQVTLRLAPDVLAHFRATGPGWQGRMEAALRAAMGDKTKRAAKAG